MRCAYTPAILASGNSVKTPSYHFHPRSDLDWNRNHCHTRPGTILYNWQCHVYLSLKHPCIKLNYPQALWKCSTSKACQLETFVNIAIQINMVKVIWKSYRWAKKWWLLFSLELFRTGMRSPKFFERLRLQTLTPGTKVGLQDSGAEDGDG